MLIELLQKKSKFDEIYTKLSKSGGIIHGLINPAKSLMLAAMLHKSTRPLVYLVSNHKEAKIFAKEIRNLCPSKPVFDFQSQEVSPYEQINSDIDVLSVQYEIFKHWQSNKPSLTVVPVKAFSQLYIEQDLLKNNQLVVAKTAKIEPKDLCKKLNLLGYYPVSSVELKGQYSHRGDILDIYPLTGKPVRLEFWGDEIESIRYFDTKTQRSNAETVSFVIYPRFSIIRNEEDKLQDKVVKVVSERNINQEILDSLDFDSDLYPEGIEYYKELLGQNHSTLFDYIPANSSFIYDEWEDLSLALKEWSTKLETSYAEKLEKNINIPLKQALHLDHSTVVARLAAINSKLYLQIMNESQIAAEDLSSEILSYPCEKFASKIEDFVDFIKKKRSENQNIIVFSEQPQRVLGILKEWDVPSTYKTDFSSNVDELIEESNAGSVLIQRDGLEEGCKIPDLDLIILTDRELFGRSRQAIARQKNQQERKKESRKDIYTDIAQLKRDDYVVHYKHGIGIYKGTEYVDLTGNVKQEYLVIEYADEARILIPVDQVNMLSRFNVQQDRKPRLSKLGGNDWERTKKKVKKSVRKIAQDLINLYSIRDKQKGYQYPPDTPWQIEMEDAFPYTETEDQLKAINSVKIDMESAKLMDRLICGDAGFGKTEVIIRTIFKVIMDGKQVAVLVPTTVLAQQHFNVFSDRFAPYPIRIGLLSRFRTAKEQKDIVAKLKTGDLDLVVGTHRLLQRDLSFKNLALLVIDEEQRFGVAHKEKLKSLRTDLDVISMSATPIPRTLHMSLSGIRDISLISTPPTNRLPIKTYVGEFRDSIIRNAALHELERGGQIFFVHNRVENIETIATYVQNLVPEANVRYAHGQMQDRELEDVMFSFVNQEFNLLVCTTIIETGLDIGSANTIIINQANHFGLSQLYQLRGRVGRSNLQAYAYLLFEGADQISDQARERLRAIREYTSLGSGYQIALRDMEIRGVGNVFGAEQHGHMLAVGFDLYCKILSDTIEEMKGNQPAADTQVETSIDLKINAYFPDNWMADEKQRMNEYKRLSSCKDLDTMELLRDEWKDRFGRLPGAAENLLELVKIKLNASKAKVSSINEEGSIIRFQVPIRLQVWLPLQRKLNNFLQTRVSFKPGAVGSRTTNSIINMKSDSFDSKGKIDAVNEILELLI